MSFTVSQKTENELQQVILADSETGTTVSVLPSCGALLHSFTIQTSSGPFNIIDNYKSLNELQTTVRSSHKSTKLSPFVCRIRNAKYRFEGIEYEFKNKFTDGSAIHGLLVNKPFQVVDSGVTSTSAILKMEYDYKTDDPAYPFFYRCVVNYTLNKDRHLHVETTVINTGHQHLPIADGWHPYFTLSGKADDWELCIHAKQTLEFDEQLIPTGKYLPVQNFYTPELLGDHFLDNCFLADTSNANPVCSLRNPANGWKLLLYAEKNYPYLQVFTPPHRNSIAIENLSAAPDCFNNGMGLIILDPGQAHTFVAGYHLSLF